MIAKASSTSKSASQRRFLDADAEKVRVAPAARTAGVHRATVYRWMTDPEFVNAMRIATQEFFRGVGLRVDVEEAERKQWREGREQSRRPMRCANLARARWAKFQR